MAEEEGDYGLLLLQDLKALFGDHKDSLASSTIVEALAAMEERPWSEYRNDRPITKRGVASLLGRFGVKPKNIRIATFAAGHEASPVVKGYTYSDLLPAFSTYLAPPNLSATSATIITGGEDSGRVADVADNSHILSDAAFAALRRVS